jgi:hypothetical protein
VEETGPLDGVIGFGPKFADNPEGMFESDRETSEAKPAIELTVTTAWALPPGCIVTLVGTTLKVKSLARPEVTTRTSTEECDCPLDTVPLSVSEKVPVEALLLTLIDKIEFREPPMFGVIARGEKFTLTPEGVPDADNETVDEKPPIGIIVRVVVPPFPCWMLIDDGETEMVKSGCGPEDVTVR